MIYPATQHYHAAMRSYTEHAKSGPLTTSIMRWFMDTYLDGLAPADPRQKLCSLASASRSGVFLAHCW